MAISPITLRATHNSSNVFAPYVEFELTPTEFETYVDIYWEIRYYADEEYYPKSSINSNCVAYIGSEEIDCRSFTIGEERTGEHLINSGNTIVYKENDAFQDIKVSLFFSFQGAKWFNLDTNSTETLGEVEAMELLSIPYIGFDSNPPSTTYIVRYNKNHNDDYDNYGDYGSFTKIQNIDYRLSFQPKRQGYIFKGWSLVTNRYGFNEVVSYNYDDMYDMDEYGIILYAVWEPLPTYTISYNTNGGSGTFDPQTQAQGQTVYLPTDKPIRDGYIFLGWTESFEDSVVYQPESAYSNEEDVTLYAAWFPVRYTIYYNANGGKDAPNNQAKYHNITSYISAKKPYKTGYKFIGWSDSPNGVVVFEAGDECKINDSFTLYAVWEKSANNIENITLYRCDAEGNKQTDGEHIWIEFSYTSIGMTSEVRVEWKCNTDYEEYNWSNSMYMNIEGGILSPNDVRVFNAVLNKTFDSNKSYAFRIKIYDTGCEINHEEGISVVMEEALISNVNYFMDFKVPETSDEAGGVGIGIEAKIDNVLDIGLKTRFLGGILYSDLKDGVNFNTLITPNNFALFAGAGYINCPIATDGTLLVEPVGVNGDVRHIVTGDKSNPSRYERYYSAIDDSWTVWTMTYNPDIGRVYTATKSVQIATDDINTNAIGAMITVPAGVYIITGEARIGTGTSAGTRNNQIRIYARPEGESASMISMERNYAASANFLVMTTSCVYTATKNTDISVTKASSIMESSDQIGSIYQDTIITAVRIV